MAEKEAIDFTSYSFTQEEYIIAATYTEEQLKHLQSTLAKFAVGKISLSAETYENPEMFVRAHEYNRGLMDGIRFLLELHNSLKDEALEYRKQQALKQRDTEEVGDWRNMAL